MPAPLSLWSMIVRFVTHFLQMGSFVQGITRHAVCTRARPTIYETCRWNYKADGTCPTKKLRSRQPALKSRLAGVAQSNLLLVLRNHMSRNCRPRCLRPLLTPRRSAYR
eukprot:6995634-Pyramimonas_sp.AAC.1